VSLSLLKMTCLSEMVNGCEAADVRYYLSINPHFIHNWLFKNCPCVTVCQ